MKTVQAGDTVWYTLNRRTHYEAVGPQPVRSVGDKGFYLSDSDYTAVRREHLHRNRLAALKAADKLTKQLRSVP